MSFGKPETVFNLNKKNMLSFQTALVIVAIILYGYSEYQILSINNGVSISSGVVAASSFSGNPIGDPVSLVISTGVPPIYGPELGVSFDNPVNSMGVMQQFDPGYGRNRVSLEGVELQRYVTVGTRISCEFCCGAKAIIFSNGQAACGCAHSQAMRGLAAYLIKNHGSQFTDDQILRELARWKSLYFPKQMINKFTTQISSGSFTPDISALILDVDTSKLNIKNAPLPTAIQDLPSMVGGC